MADATNTVRPRAPRLAERVYRAFLDPDAWPNGSRRTALPARSTRATRGWAAATACRSPTSAPARPMPLAARTSN